MSRRTTKGMRKSLFKQFLEMFNVGDTREAVRFFNELSPHPDRSEYSHRSGTFKKNRRVRLKINRRKAMKMFAR
jgi:hypothetical protein